MAASPKPPSQRQQTQPRQAAADAIATATSTPATSTTATTTTKTTGVASLFAVCVPPTSSQPRRFRPSAKRTAKESTNDLLREVIGNQAVRAAAALVSWHLGHTSGRRANTFGIRKYV